MTTRYEAAFTKDGTRPHGDSLSAVLDMINSFGLVDEIRAAVMAIHLSTSLSDAQKLAAIVQWVLTKAPEHRTQVIEHYWNIVRAYRPPSSFRGSSHSVMDGDYKKSVPSSEPGHSIELFFPATLADGRLGFTDFVDYAIGYIANATQTFFAGYFALRFTGPTRAYLGMQQWKQTCSVEISVVQGVRDLPELLNALLSDGTHRGGLAHWGQQIDLAFTKHGSIYPHYTNWRQAYAKLSNNFISRTFENDLSLRWNLTRPNDSKFVSQTVSDVMALGQSQSVTVTMQNTGALTWTRSASYRLGTVLVDLITHKAIWGITRVELPSDVLPGEQVTFRFNIVAQDIPNPKHPIPDPRDPTDVPVIRRLFQWKMLQEMVEWFGVDTPPVMITID